MQYINSQSKRNFKILNNETEVLSGVQPRWYSLGIEFKFEDKLFQIKKNNFWGTSFECNSDGLTIAEMSLMWKKENIINFKEGVENEFQKYHLKNEKAKSWMSLDKIFTLINKSNLPVLRIHFSYEKLWKEKIDIEFLSQENYPLLMCAMFLIKQKQNSSNNFSDSMVMG